MQLFVGMDFIFVAKNANKIKSQPDDGLLKEKEYETQGYNGLRVNFDCEK